MELRQTRPIRHWNETFPGLYLSFHETFPEILSPTQTKEGLLFIYGFRFGVQSFLGHDHLPFARARPEEAIPQAVDDEGVVFGQDARSVYTPALSLWAFLSQVLFKGEQRSCVAAVSRVVVVVVALGRERCSDNTGAYCRARAKLPVVVLRRLTQEVAARCEEQLPGAWLWKGRHVHLVDGTTVSMPVTVHGVVLR